MSKTAIVILNYNGEKFLRQFLPSVLGHTPKKFPIMVADNASTDGSVAFLETQYPDLQLIKLQNNTGYAGGYNEALRMVEADYYLLLNSDIEVSPNWIEPLVECLDKNSKIAAVQPKIRSFAQKHLFEHAGAAGGFLDYLGFPFCRGRIFDTVEADEGQYDDSIPVFWASGACMLVRGKVFQELGAFDADFFAHMEEIDLCWRMHNADHEVWYCPESVVFHLGGGTLNYVSPFKTYLNFRNNLVMMLKNLPSTKVFPIVFVRMVLDGLAGLRFLAQGKFAHFWAVLRSHFYLYQNFFKILTKRKENLQKAKHFEHTEIYQKSIVWKYFGKGKKKFRD